MPLSQADVEEEQAHFANVLSTFKQYAPYALNANNRRRKDFHTLPLADRELLEALGYKEKLLAADEAILANAAFLERLVANPEIFPDEDDDEEIEDGEEEDDHEHGQSLNGTPGHSHSHDGPSHGHTHGHSHDHGHSHSHNHDHGDGAQYRPTANDMDKLHSTLKQFVRDWSAEGKAERDLAYVPIKQALLDHFSDIPPEERANFNVLVPGAGLGRLAWDVAKLGFSCQGNEFSHYMLLASFYILNRTDAIDKHTIFPYVHSFSNVPDRAAMLRPISIPDVLPSSLPPDANFSLVAGDFEEIYGAEDAEGDAGGMHAGPWDAVLTCFFIDTAKNVVNYLRIIHRILAPGGVWINLGPLLWHWENNTTNDPSVELTVEEVKALARSVGFEISNERTIDTTYTNNAQSMLGYVYHSAFWTAKKIV